MGTIRILDSGNLSKLTVTGNSFFLLTCHKAAARVTGEFPSGGWTEAWARQGLPWMGAPPALVSQLGLVTPFPLPSGGAGLSGAPDRPRPWAMLFSCVPELCRWGAPPWGLTLDSSAAVHSCGCRLCKVCCHLISHGAQTLNTFSEDYNSELVFSFLPLPAFSVALVSALASSTRRWPFIVVLSSVPEPARFRALNVAHRQPHSGPDQPVPRASCAGLH